MTARSGELAAGATRRRTPRAWPARALLLLMAMSVAACTSDDTYLPALLADPMASYEAPGIVLIDAWEVPEGRDIIMDSPTHAQVGRTYRIEDQGQAERVLEEAATYAESNGWRLTPSRPSPTGYGGAKDLAPGDARIGISLVAADPLNDRDGPRVLRIHMDFGSVRFDDTTTSPP